MMDLFMPILGMTLIVLGLLTVVISVAVLIYYNIFWPGRKKGLAPFHSGVAPSERYRDTAE